VKRFFAQALFFLQVLWIACFLWCGLLGAARAEAGYPQSAFAMVRADISAYLDGKKQVISLSVRETGQEGPEENVFLQDSAAQHYLMLLRPGKDYRLRVSPEPPYHPYEVPLYIPPQTYHYYFAEVIHFTPIRLLDTIIGQRVRKDPTKHEVIKMTEKSFVGVDSMQRLRENFLTDFVGMMFRSGNKKVFASLKRVEEAIALYEKQPEPAEPEAPTVDPNSEKLFELMQKAMQGDKDARARLDGLSQAVSQENDGKDVYFAYGSSAQEIQVTPSEAWLYGETAQPARLLHGKNYRELTVQKTKIWFEGKRKRLTKAQKEQLQEIAQFLNQENSLFVEVMGKTALSDSLNVMQTLRLTSRRTRKVLRYLKRTLNNPEQFGMVAYGFGQEFLAAPEAKQPNVDPSHVELRIVCRATVPTSHANLNSTTKP